MKEPTQEQIKEFWEWCGWKWLDDLQCWESPDTTRVRLNRGGIYNVLLDLNNLFKYAVPKITALETYTLTLTTRQGITNVSIMPNYMGIEKGGYAWDKDPALALFAPIWEIIKGDS